MTGPPLLGSELAARLDDLLRPAAYPHAATDIRLVETHISWVILAGKFAYKLRKPVNFGFLDFSSPEQRLHDCEAEVHLNRRLCADLYLGVVSVVERDGRLAIGGKGRYVEPAVCMRRLPESGMLPHLIERCAIDVRIIQRIAQQLSDFHAHAATGPGVDQFGGIEVVSANWAENFAQTADCADAVLPPAARRGVGEFAQTFLAANRRLLEDRIAEGRIRDGHGDLHANSVCVVRRRVYLFDCIEFSARFRCADVAAEVAFLAMDLDHLGRADLGHAFTEAYVRASGDQRLTRLLSFFKCYRAYVRGKVLALRLRQAELTPARRDEIIRGARAYFDLAHAYARPPQKPTLFVVMGLRDSGNTTLARALASRLALVHLSFDDVRKKLGDLRLLEHSSDRFEHGLYTRAMSRRTYALLRRTAVRWLRRDQSVVLDATYGQPAERAAMARAAQRASARMIVVVCGASEEPREIANAVHVDTALPLERQVEAVFQKLQDAESS